ncbi:hypothetical protein BHM03_00030689 [Ensete ventricosum]|nr:hypothetical protein BHM03_00030689 [Ensete ventricosum]
MKPSGSAGSGSTTPSMASASPAVEVVASMAEKHPDTNEDVNLRKRSKRVASEQLAGVTRSTTKAPTEKGKSQLRREMSQRRTVGLTPTQEDRDAQTNNKELKLRVSQEVVATIEHREKELKATVDQLRAELGSSENRCKNIKQEVDTLHSSLQGVQDDRARRGGCALVDRGGRAP